MSGHQGFSQYLASWSYVLAVHMSTQKLDFVFSLKLKDQCQGWFLLITYLCFCYLTLPRCLCLLSPVVPHGLVPLQFWPAHAISPRPEECALPAIAKDPDSCLLHLLGWPSAGHGYQSVFPFQLKCFIFVLIRSWSELMLGSLMMDCWEWRVTSCWFTKFNIYLYYWFEMWVNILGTNHKNLLSCLLVEQIMIYPSSSSSLLPLRVVLLCVRCTNCFTCVSVLRLVLLLCSFCKWGTWSLVRSNDLPKDVHNQ